MRGWFTSRKEAPRNAENMKYHISEYCRNRWHVVDETGLPVYDGALYGNDRPRIFKDEDEAYDFAERLNIDNDEETNP